MWPRTELQELLGIEHPIIQAPMSSITTPELAAAVSNVGALGSLGCGILPADTVREQVTALRALTNRPFNLISSPIPSRPSTGPIGKRRVPLRPCRLKKALQRPLQSGHGASCLSGLRRAISRVWCSRRRAFCSGQT
jgi:NAD(P)H-dependent flavin oxidoreductase YrpB (nitropropane dioxygenase family)